MLGDSTAAGYGVHTRAETPGALLATWIADGASRPVRLTCPAVVGSVSAWLPAQVETALEAGADLAIIFIGANDVTTAASERESRCGTWPTRCGTLRDAGAEVVVATCPDLGTVRPIQPPLRWLARRWSRQLAAAQTDRRRYGPAAGRVSLGDLLGPQFDAAPDRMFGADRFHPSAEGYRGRGRGRAADRAGRARPGHRRDGGRPRSARCRGRGRGRPGTGSARPVAAPRAAARSPASRRGCGRPQLRAGSAAHAGGRGRAKLAADDRLAVPSLTGVATRRERRGRRERRVTSRCAALAKGAGIALIAGTVGGAALLAAEALAARSRRYAKPDLGLAVRATPRRRRQAAAAAGAARRLDRARRRRRHGRGHRRRPARPDARRRRAPGGAVHAWPCPGPAAPTWPPRWPGPSWASGPTWR